MAIDNMFPQGGMKEMKAYRFLLVLLMLGIAMTFASDSMAASVTINHAGGTLNGTLSSLSVNSDGNVAVTVTENLTGSSGGGGGTADTQAPSVPSGLNAAAASSSQINLSWSVSSDNVGVAGYKIYRDGSQIATTSSTSYANSGLSASTGYCYKVAAYDSAQNNSEQSGQACATTSAADSGGGSGDGSTTGGIYLPMGDKYSDYVSVNSPKKYYYHLANSVNRHLIQMTTTEWDRDANMIVSTSSYPSCTDSGKAGTYSNYNDTSNEIIYLPGSAGTYYVTVCGDGGYKLFWNAY